MNIPEHVPSELVYQFDHNTDEGLLIAPEARFLELLKKFPGGLFYSPCLGGFWVTTNYDAYVAVVRNTEVFSSKQITVPPTDGAYRLIPVNIDPPEHAKYRSVLAKQFSPGHMRKLEGDIRMQANQLIDEIAKKNSCDFVAEFAEILPVTVFMKMMGLPIERLNEFREWAMIALTETDPAVRMPTMMKIIGLMTEILHARQTSPEDDLISVIIHAEIEGRPITMEEAQAYCLLLFLAGLDTVVNAMSFGLRHLANHKELQQQLRENPEIAPDFVEESLRRYSFVNIGRVLACDYEFNGQLMKKGELIIVPQIPANLDEKAFENPLDFELDRKGSSRHVAFNTGPHNCLGAHLARIELALTYQEWCKRMPEFGEDPSTTPVLAAGPVMGMRNLQLVW
ncbi:cytochrome P450 [Spongiibacter nanhainus]|uniref:Cytochrome P450 n=1 Tax=Spongiibacter nanhainus TaxID=2794344 RepID=A0A7T4QZ38_9GAMM|nr:cytochrome P450 [Spongiibacter nanhainus]QQD17339.1 cytochrome P450 [Spongiibacter nanhainus]